MANKADIAKLEAEIAKLQSQVCQQQYTINRFNQESRRNADSTSKVDNLVDALIDAGDLCTKSDLERAISDLEIEIRGPFKGE